MPRSAVVWSLQYDSLEAFATDAPANTSTSELVAVGAPASSAPTDDQLADARDKAQRMVAADSLPGADYSVTLEMDANGVMSVRVARNA